MPHNPAAARSEERFRDYATDPALQIHTGRHRKIHLPVPAALCVDGRPQHAAG